MNKQNNLIKNVFVLYNNNIDNNKNRFMFKKISERRVNFK
jgi:hypothetical protein